LDDVVPFWAGHCENERVGEEHPPTDGAAVIRVGLEEVAELVGVEEPVGGAVGARACGGEDRGWMCPRQGRGGERVGAVLRADGRGLGTAVVGGTGPSGRVRGCGLGRRGARFLLGDIRGSRWWRWRPGRRVRGGQRRPGREATGNLGFPPPC
jgi:hypothetical protein